MPSEWTITGVDLLPDHLVRHTHPNFRYLRRDATDLGHFANREFDLVVAIGLLEHVTDDDTFNRIVSGKVMMNNGWDGCAAWGDRSSRFRSLVSYHLVMALKYRSTIS